MKNKKTIAIVTTMVMALSLVSAANLLVSFVLSDVTVTSMQQYFTTIASEQPLEWWPTKQGELQCFHKEDEVECIQCFKWSTETLNNLRHLVSREAMLRGSFQWDLKRYEPDGRPFSQGKPANVWDYWPSIPLVGGVYYTNLPTLPILHG